jgi:hypothetical protein
MNKRLSALVAHRRDGSDSRQHTGRAAEQALRHVTIAQPDTKLTSKERQSGGKTIRCLWWFVPTKSGLGKRKC